MDTFDRPLDLPLSTLEAVGHANRAAKRTRQALETSLAPALAGLALSGVGLASFMLVAHAQLSDPVRWAVAGAALLMAWTGVVLMYAYLWSWIRRARVGGRTSPFGDATATRGNRWRLVFFAIVLSVVLLEAFGLRMMRSRVPDAIYFGILIWGTRLSVLLVVALYVYRFVRSTFWEYLAFAAGILATGGLYIFVPPRQLNSISPASSVIATVCMLATMVAALLLVARWRRWTRANEAEKLDDIASGEGV